VVSGVLGQEIDHLVGKGFCEGGRLGAQYFGAQARARR
jgi:hypothetical protein